MDEVEITNVGGKNGVASEVTLVKLQSAIENLAGKKGVDAKSANEGLVNLKKKLGQNEKEIEKEVEARGESTDALDEHTDALGKASRGLMSFGGAIIGSGIQSVQGLSRELIEGSNNLSDFAQHIPLIGNALTIFTGILDNSVNTFQRMAKSGADFDYNLGQMRVTAARAGLSLEQFAGMITENSDKIAAFGGTVTQGARQTSRLVGSLGEQREQLQAMGLTFEDISEQMQFYQFVNRAGARTEQRNQQQQAEAAASLSKNMLQLSKLTGEDVKAQQEKIAQAQMDVAFQRELAKMDKDERDKLNKAMADAQATGGEVAVDAIKAEVLGMPPLTKRLQTYVATQGESARIQQEAARRAMDSSVTADEFEERRLQTMGDYLESQLAAGEEFDTLLKAGAMGAEGIAAELSDQLGMSQDVLMKYIDDTGGQLSFAREEFEKDFGDALPKVDGDGELGAMAEFRDALRGTRTSLMENLVNPLMNLITPAIGEATTSLDDFTESDAFTEFSKTIKNKLEEFKTWFGDWIGKFKEDPQAAWDDLMENHIKPFFDKAVKGVTDTIGTAFKDAITSPSVIGSLVAGFGSLFAAKAVSSALTKGIAGMFARAGAARAASTATGSAAGAATKKSGNMGKMLKGGARLGAKAALPLTATLALIDGIKGASNAEDILGMQEGEETNFGDKAAAALGSALQGVSFGLINQESVARGLTGRDSDVNEGRQSGESSDQIQQQDLSTAQAAATVSDAQIERLEKLVGFAPQVRILSDDIQSLEKTFNSLDLNYRHIDRTTRSLEKLESMSTLESKFRALSDYLTTDAENKDQISENQIQSLQSLVGLEPKLQKLNGSISGFQQEFNSLDLNYREVDRTTRSLEKMAEQLEEINTQLQGGEEGFLDKMNPLSDNNKDKTTAGDLLSDSGMGSSDQVEKLNRTMQDILGVLMASNDVNRKQLGAARSMTADLYRGF